LRTDAVLLSLIFSFSFALPGITLLAEERECTGVSIDIRALIGSEPASDGVGGVSAASLDSDIKDLASQLSRLRYEKFELLDFKQQEVNLRSRRKVELPRGQKLVFKPMYVEGNRVGMWMRWNDHKGMRLLDTLMHFECGETIVSGVESSNDHGYILAIKVHPIYK